MTGFYRLLPLFALALAPNSEEGQTSFKNPFGAGSPAPPHYRWVAMTSNDPVPPNRIGLNRDSEHNYDQSICRVVMHGGVHPGKYLPDIRVCNVSWGNSGEAYHQFEILVGDKQGVWTYPEKTSDGRFLFGRAIGQKEDGSYIYGSALVGGHMDDGSPIYVCSAQHENPGRGEIQIGKLVANNCDFEYGGKELILRVLGLYYLTSDAVIDNP